MQRRLACTLIAAAAGLSTLSTTARAAEGPYDPAADAHAQIQAALAQAASPPDGKPVLVVFGANWCGDCKALDAAFKGPAMAPWLADHFQVVKVDVGKFDRNTDIAAAYGVPLKQGIPTVAVLSPAGQVVYATTGGELADARHLGDAGIRDFLAQVAARAKP